MTMIAPDRIDYAGRTACGITQFHIEFEPGEFGKPIRFAGWHIADDGVSYFNAEKIEDIPWPVAECIMHGNYDITACYVHDVEGWKRITK